MKRLCTFFLTAGLLLFAAQSWAGPQYESIRLKWRTSTAVNTTALGYVDSTSFSKAAAARSDTSVAFILEDRAFVPYVLGADSLELMDVYVTSDPTSSVTTASDSTYFTLEGSFNGSTWIPSVQTGVIPITGTAVNSSYKGYHTTRLGVVTAAAATSLQMGAFPMYRLIVRQGTAGATGRWVGYVRYWKDSKAD